MRPAVFQVVVHVQVQLNPPGEENALLKVIHMSSYSTILLGKGEQT